MSACPEARKSAEAIVNAAAGRLVFHVLSVIGNGLAAIGIAVTVYVIGRKEYIVFFLLAYFLSVMLSSLSIPMITYAILGTVIAVIFVLAQSSQKE